MNKIFEIIGACCSLGGKDPGNANGPDAIRAAGLQQRISALGVHIVDAGNAREPARPASVDDPKLKYLPEYLTFAAELLKLLDKAYNAGNSPIIIGGDHSLSIAAVSKAAILNNDMGLLWVDSHADCNTRESTPSGDLHGMIGSFLLGLGEESLVNLYGKGPKIKPENLAYIGLRSVDPGEKELIKRYGIEAYTMRDIDELGLGEVCHRALGKMRALKSFYLSFDLDVIDPHYAPGVSCQVEGGLTLREAHLIMELVAKCSNLVAAEIVEYSPGHDLHGRTANLAVSLIETLCGRKVL